MGCTYNRVLKEYESGDNSSTLNNYINKDIKTNKTIIAM